MSYEKSAGLKSLNPETPLLDEDIKPKHNFNEFSRDVTKQDTALNASTNLK